MAVIYNEDNFEKAMHLADKLRGDYDTSLFLQPKKIGKLYAKLEADGFVGAMTPDWTRSSASAIRFEQIEQKSAERVGIRRAFYFVFTKS